MSPRRISKRLLHRRARAQRQSTVVPRVSTLPTTELESFPNPTPYRDYEVAFDCPEFTCLCPLTGQPDFATIRIRYVPNKRCVELKSLKLYLWSYREVKAFHEEVTNRILDDLVQAVEPRRATVVGDFFVRGGIHTTVTASYEQGSVEGSLKQGKTIDS